MITAPAMEPATTPITMNRTTREFDFATTLVGAGGFDDGAVADGEIPGELVIAYPPDGGMPWAGVLVCG
jgi:hypothetical protein